MKTGRHSAGALVAVDAYFEAPERVAALILVAPAILAPFTMKKNSAKENQNVTDDQSRGKSSASNVKGNPILRIGSTLSMLTKYIGEAILYLIKGMAGMINSLYQKALSAILRSTFGVILVIIIFLTPTSMCSLVLMSYLMFQIRMIINKFGTQAVRSAWYDSKQVSDDVLQGYTKVSTWYLFSTTWIIPLFYFQCWVKPTYSQIGSH